jgi:RNA polymerase sigma-70 factor (ECF subfamily)
MGVRIEDVDDVVQEVFVVVHGRLDSLDQHESLRSWIYGTVRRTVSTYRRAALGRSHRELLEPSPDDNANPLQPSQLELAMQSDELQLLWRLLEQVDPVKREVFVLSELEEMTVPEIAEAIGIGVNTAYSRLRAGKQEYCAAFARYVAQQKGRP